MPSLKAIAVAGALVFAPAIAQAEDLAFLLINESSADLVSFHVSPADSSVWEENLMARCSLMILPMTTT